MNKDLKEFVEDFMVFSCKYCWEVKNFTECEQRFTKCLDKAVFLGRKMIEKGWKRDSDESVTV
jgi:hypothetical protein